MKFALHHPDAANAGELSPLLLATLAKC